MPKQQSVLTIDRRTVIAATGSGTYRPSAHTHTGGDVISQVSDADTVDGQHAAAFAAASHDHDDRYYTESEIGTLLGGYVLKTTFDANSLLIANTDDTPVALTVGASTLVGRASSGGIAALSASSARTVLGLATTDTVQFAKLGLGTATVPDNIHVVATRPIAKFTASGALGPARYGAFVDRNSYQSVNLYFDGSWNLDDTSRPGAVLSLANGDAGISLQVRHATAGSNPRTLTEGFRTETDGSIGIGDTGAITISDGVGVDVNGKILRLRASKTPASASATGNVGEICWDSGAIYVCVATNTWKKVAIATW